MSVAAIQTFAKNTEALEENLLQKYRRMVHCFKLQKDKLVDAFITLQLATAQIIFGPLFGTNGLYDDEGLLGLLQLTDSYSEAVNGSSHVDFLPLLKNVPDKALSKLKFLLKSFNDVTTEMFF